MLYADEWPETGYDAIIDFTAGERGRYVFTRCTWDPRQLQKADVPFLLTTVMLGPAGAPQIDHEILLTGEPVDAARIAKLTDAALAALAHPDGQEAGASPLRTALGHLRNMAIVEAGPILPALAKIRDKAAGPLADIVSGFQDEVENIQAVREENVPTA